jgi:long-chain acyl-CoA synthetase
MVNSAEWLTHPGTVGRRWWASSRSATTRPAPRCRPARAAPSTSPTAGRSRTTTTRQDRQQHPQPKGWTTLGDVGYVDAEGFLYLTDRKAYMIISGGVNIYPQEAENVLITTPRWPTWRCSACPNEEFGEEVKAVVQPRDMRDAGPELEAELIAYCREHLSHDQVPAQSSTSRPSCRATPPASCTSGC